MWSVWSETVEVYLGQGIAVLEVAHKDPITLHSPPTLPMERVLAKLADLAASQIKRGSKLRVSLSGVLCPPLVSTIPEGVTRWEERREIALAFSAREMGLSADDIACEIDAFTPGLSAAISSPTLEILQLWATQLGCRLLSVSPLWAMVTKSDMASQSHIKSLMLVEPDGVTWLTLEGEAISKAKTCFGAVDSSVLKEQSLEWLLENEQEESNLLGIGYRVEVQPVQAGHPKQWARHWCSA